MAETSDAIGRGVKLVGETLVAPGTSLLLDGDIKNGGLHVIGGLLAKAVIGPIGWIAVAANSYATSTTEKNLVENLKSS